MVHQYFWDYSTGTDTIPTATWAPTSTIKITGTYTTAPRVLNGFTLQTFGNVIYDPTSQTNTVCMFPGAAGNSFTTNIAGNFSITWTGSSVRFTVVFSAAVSLDKLLKLAVISVCQQGPLI
jgi:hypothetical protein